MITNANSICNITYGLHILPRLVDQATAKAEVECHVKSEVLIAQAGTKTSGYLRHGIAYFVSFRCICDIQTVFAYDSVAVFVSFPSISVPVTHCFSYMRFKCGCTTVNVNMAQDVKTVN